MVRTHFEQVVSASEERDAVARSFEQAAAALKVRLYQDGYGGAVHRPLAEGIVESLVLDLPSTVASVSDDDVAAWGQELSGPVPAGLREPRRRPAAGAGAARAR